MTETVRDCLIKECKTIAENSLYTAQAHFEVANEKENWRKRLLTIPAVVAATGAIAAVAFSLSDTFAGAKLFIDGLVAVSASVSAVASFLNFDKQVGNHYQAAKSYTLLRHDANSLEQTFSKVLTDDEFKQKVESLRDRYSTLVQATDATDEKAFSKARENIQSGRFEMDYLTQNKNAEMKSIERKTN